MSSILLLYCSVTPLATPCLCAPICACASLCAPFFMITVCLRTEAHVHLFTDHTFAHPFVAHPCAPLCTPMHLCAPVCTRMAFVHCTTATLHHTSLCARHLGATLRKAPPLYAKYYPVCTSAHLYASKEGRPHPPPLRGPATLRMRTV